MSLHPVIVLLFLSARLAAQPNDASKAIEAGNGFYKKQEYNRAAAEYTKALQADPSNNKAKFNQANTLYKQEQKVEAVQLFTAIGREEKDNDLRSRSFYNKGVILSQQKNLEESIEAYKSTLRLNPDDKEARENLQKALLELKKKAPPPPRQDKKQDNKKQDQKQQQKQQQSKMSPKETEQRLKLLQQKEKEVQQRLQRERSKSGGSQPKDW